MIRPFELVLTKEDAQKLQSQKHLTLERQVLIILPRYYKTDNGYVNIHKQSDHCQIYSPTIQNSGIDPSIYTYSPKNPITHTFPNFQNNKDYYAEDQITLNVTLNIKGTEVDVTYNVSNSPQEIITPPIYDDNKGNTLGEAIKGFGGYVIILDSELGTYVLTRYLGNTIKETINQLSPEKWRLDSIFHKYIFGFDALYSILYKLKGLSVDYNDFSHNLQFPLFRKNFNNDTLEQKTLELNAQIDTLSKEPLFNQSYWALKEV